MTSPKDDLGVEDVHSVLDPPSSEGHVVEVVELGVLGGVLPK